MITAQVLDPGDSLDSLKPDWDRLFRQLAAEPSLSFEWSTAMLRNHLKATRDWFVVVLRHHADVVGIVPMMRVRDSVLGCEIVSLQPIQHLNNTHGGLLIDTQAGAIGAWIDALATLDQRWDLLRLSRLLEGNALGDQVAEECRRRGLRAGQKIEQPSFYLTLPGDYSKYLAERSGKFRNYLKRAERKLGELGRVEFARVQAADDEASAYAELLSIEAESWKHDHGTAISAKPHQTGFYRDLVESALRLGSLHLTFLRLDGRAVAYNLGLVANGCYFYLKTSFREPLRAQGVATVGRSRLIQLLIDEGLGALDFPGEPYEWERQWTEQLRWHRCQLIYNKTAVGQGLWLFESVRRLVRHRSDERRVVFCDPRDAAVRDI